MGGTEAVKVQLTAEEPIGGLVLSKLEQGDTLTGLNVACQEIRRNCPYGYDEFMDMLAPKKDAMMDRFHFLPAVCPLPAQCGHRCGLSDGGNRPIPLDHGELCPCV